MATIRDVARKAGLSVATVSRVMSGRGYVSPSSRERVLRAAEALAYVPNGMARGLKTQRSGLIALLVPEIVNGFYTTISRGVEDVANANGRQVIVGNTDEDVAKERAYVDLMIASRVDGVIMAPAGRSTTSLRTLTGAGIPTVLIDRALPDGAADIVRGDSRGGAKTLTRHLLNKGHRRIALINGHLDTSVAQEREGGYREALTEADVKVDDRLISSGTWFIDDAAVRAGALLDRGVAPTAILATNSFMVIGTLRALRERGLSVPEVISLVCFDDLEWAAEIDPFLTALSQPAYEMGATAMRLLVERITRAYQGPPRELVLEPTLLVRRSSREVGPPAGAVATSTSEDEPHASLWALTR